MKEWMNEIALYSRLSKNVHKDISRLKSEKKPNVEKSQHNAFWTFTFKKFINTLDLNIFFSISRELHATYGIAVLHSRDQISQNFAKKNIEIKDLFKLKDLLDIFVSNSNIYLPILKINADLTKNILNTNINFIYFFCHCFFFALCITKTTKVIDQIDIFFTIFSNNISSYISIINITYMIINFG